MAEVLIRFYGGHSGHSQKAYWIDLEPPLLILLATIAKRAM